MAILDLKLRYAVGGDADQTFRREPSGIRMVSALGTDANALPIVLRDEAALRIGNENGRNQRAARLELVVQYGRDFQAAVLRAHNAIDLPALDDASFGGGIGQGFNLRPFIPLGPINSSAF